MSVRSMGLNDALARARWAARLAWEEAAWPEFLAVAVVGFALGLVLWVNRPLHQEVRDLQASVAIATRDRAAVPADSSSIGMRPGGSGAGFVADFLAFLPAVDMREQQLQTLHSLAGESGAALSRVEYGHSNLEHLPGRRMTMQLTVQAEYAAYRKLLHNLLVAMPNLSIDRVTMERVPGQASRLNVRVEASLYYRNAAAGGAS
ncbi:hypothetical protein J2W25_000868 [Variovorax boronicumulans]|uniref:Pilus assembly protein PilO n=1 Tax=Variovorax boronicumulans TaxID=436515 RepID=A0AAW8DQN6_9BURK|nr:GspMb/PilO family protein [Variovorax boronicumulans]MDP9877270.1 hypothetical protein [Variovorax boronicumulans]MDP9921853.1 hypothetical protein [Variovorax boronicumulans]